MRFWCSGPVLVMLSLTTAAQAAPPQPERAPRTVEQPRARVWREPPGPMEEGRYAVPVAGNLQVGVGRFRVVEPARPRTHTEPIARAADLSRRDRGIAAVGLSLRF